MILLDTHVLVWAVMQPKRLSRAAASAIRRARRSGGLAVSAITLWELALLISKERIEGPASLEVSLKILAEGVSIRPLTAEIAALGAQFPPDYPRDPADRIIGATARAEDMVLVTHDEKIRRSPLLKTLW